MIKDIYYILIPRYRKATELAKNAIISQKLNANVLTLLLIVASFLMVTFPKYNPATATAANPDTPKEFARTTEPKTVTMVNDVSESGSFISV